MVIKNFFAGNIDRALCLAIGSTHYTVSLIEKAYETVHISSGANVRSDAKSCQIQRVADNARPQRAAEDSNANKYKKTLNITADTSTDLRVDAELSAGNFIGLYMGWPWQWRHFVCNSYCDHVGGIVAPTLTSAPTVLYVWINTPVKIHGLRITSWGQFHYFRIFTYTLFTFSTHPARRRGCVFQFNKVVAQCASCIAVSQSTCRSLLRAVPVITTGWQQQRYRAVGQLYFQGGPLHSRTRSLHPSPSISLLETDVANFTYLLIILRTEYGHERDSVLNTRTHKQQPHRCTRTRTEFQLYVHVTDLPSLGD